MRKVIIQASLTPHSYGKQNYDAGFLGCNHEMLRLTYQRHSAYARAHKYDYWQVCGTLHPDMKGGGYDKIDLIGRALTYGYEYVVWIDADAAIMDFAHDLTEALTTGDFGACLHDPAKSAYLRQFGVPAHHNVGVTYWRNTPVTRQFVKDWYASYPGLERWQEQGSFNELITHYPGVFETCADKWNATVNVNPAADTVVKGWHGVNPIAKRLLLMKKELSNDFLTFKVR